LRPDSDCAAFDDETGFTPADVNDEELPHNSCTAGETGWDRSPAWNSERKIRSDGGVLVALAEMAMASGIGARMMTHPRDIPGHAFWFGEDQARYLVAVPDHVAFTRIAEAAGIPAMRLGTSGGQDLTLPDGGTISISALRMAHEHFFPSWMDGTTS